MGQEALWWLFALAVLAAVLALEALEALVVVVVGLVVGLVLLGSRRCHCMIWMDLCYRFHQSRRMGMFRNCSRHPIYSSNSWRRPLPQQPN